MTVFVYEFVDFKKHVPNGELKDLKKGSWQNLKDNLTEYHISYSEGIKEIYIEIRDVVKVREVIGKLSQMKIKLKDKGCILDLANFLNKRGTIMTG